MQTKVRLVHLLLLVLAVSLCGFLNNAAEVSHASYTNEPPSFVLESNDGSKGSVNIDLEIPHTTLSAENISHTLNGSVLLKAGTYSLTESLQVTSNTKLYAEAGAKLTFSGNSYLNLTGDNITVCGLDVQGDGSSEFGIRANGDFITVAECLVHDIGRVGAFGFGITFEYESQCGLIVNNVVRNTGLDGIHLRGNQNTTVSNNIVVDSNDDGIASIFGTNNLITNNTVDRKGTSNPAGNGIYVADEGTVVERNHIANTPLNGITTDDFEGYQARQLKIANNTIVNAGTVKSGVHYGGILLNYVYDSAVVGNVIDGSLYDGIRVFNSSRNLISQNVVSNSHRAPDGWGCSIVLEYQSTHNLILANNVEAEPDILVEVGLGVDFNKVYFNGVVPNGEVHLEGADSVVLQRLDEDSIKAINDVNTLWKTTF